MKRVWRTLKRRANKPDWEGRFIEAVCIFFTGPRGFDALSNQEAVKKGVGIIATARDLRAKLVDIRLRYALWDLFEENCLQGHNSFDLWRELEKRGAIHGGANDIVNHFRDIVSKDIKVILAALEKKIEREIHQGRILVRPHHKNARLHHFVRRLTQYMRQEFGQPLRQAVADTATVVFDLPKSLTKEDIARLAP